MTKKILTKEDIQKKYQDYLLTETKIPSNVRIFTKFANITDEDFYQHFGALDAVEPSIWESYFSATFNTLSKDEDFEKMSGREKHLSFLYTLLEIIKEDRSYIQYRLCLKNNSSIIPKYLIKANKVISYQELNWVNIPNFAPEKSHKLLNSSYKQLLWKHSISMLLFWVKDDSEASQNTDAFIEKSTKTLFDIGDLPVANSLVDFGKFLFQNSIFSKK